MVNYRKNISPESMEEELNPTAQQQYVSKFRKENYLNLKLEKGQNEKELKVRFLTVDKDSDSAYKVVQMHTVQVPEEISPSGWKGYTCLKKSDIDHEKYGSQCPFCEQQHIAYEKKVEAEKKAIAEGRDPKKDPDVIHWGQISYANKAVPTAIMRCIERGHEADGPKFLKAPIRDDGKDIMNVIKKIYRDRKQESIDMAMEDNNGVLPEDFEPYNVLDLENGRDFKITVERVFDKAGKPTKKTSLTIVDYGNPKPLSKNEEEADEWVNDEKKWDDVFVIKSYEYLDIVADGEIPFFDKTQGKWVPKKKKANIHEDSEEEIEAEKHIRVAEQAIASDYEGEEDEDEDTEALPF